MASILTREQVLALAPDSASLKSANALASQSKWVLLGDHAQAL